MNGASVRPEEDFGVVSYWVGVGSSILSFFLNICCSLDFGVVAVLWLCFGFLSFGHCSGALNGWSLVNTG